MLRSQEPKKTLARSLTKRLTRSLSKRSSSMRSSAIAEPPVRPTISLPLERSPDDSSDDVIKRHSRYQQERARWVVSPPSSPTSSSSEQQSPMSSSPFSRSSTSSRSSYNSGDESYFTSPLTFEKKVSFREDTNIIPRRGSGESNTSSVYAAENQLPPATEEDEEIMAKIGEFRFAAAEYIREIEGTPMILVDGKLYL